MRHHLEILEEIEKLLAINGLEDERSQLEFEIRASATGSELCLRSGSKLLALQIINDQVSLAVGHLIKEFITYCHSNGLYPETNYEA